MNNAVFFSYVELARIRYLLDVLQPAESFDRLPLILARVELDFRSPILFGEEVTVETRVDRIGTHQLRDAPPHDGRPGRAAGRGRADGARHVRLRRRPPDAGAG